VASYISKILRPNEIVLHRGKIHWFIYIKAIISAFMAAAAWVAIYMQAWLYLALHPDRHEVISWGVMGAAILFSLSAFVSFVKGFIERISTELAITDQRIIAKKGFIKRTTSEINNSKIEGVSVIQSIVGRIFGFGTVIVQGTGGGIAPMDKIDDPLIFRNHVPISDSNSK